ncbi:OmpA family protein [Mesonia sp. K7]|uniref:OmpA family protein n=1 Tax=Mesonia sp. K7 TaxID=2218606 RepID=UPI000DA7A510|nr:OmpA family protein [Mesonia sp. K7]PZD77146.1 OmpA family protein [Mesonia sp. K7]
MKKLTLALSLFFVAFATQAQETDSELQNYDHWSIDIGGGFNKATHYFSSGAFTDTPSVWNADLGVRYMINNKFGIKANVGISELNEKDESIPFQNRFFRTTLEGVINAGEILGFREWTQTFNLLVHGGIGIGQLRINEESPLADEKDKMGILTVGFTPQVRLGNSIALNLDVSALALAGQDIAWDGYTTQPVNRGFDGMMFNVGLGLNIYLGANEKHADWYGDDMAEDNALEELEGRVAAIETGMLDTDKDGVPDYLDREPNTMNGVAVDTKGVAVDKNGNGIPDELESSLDERYAAASSETTTGGGSGAIRTLINDGYVNVYFKFNSDEPEVYSLDAINYLVKYMNANPSANAELVGYADEIGDEEYNRNLSERRAKKVYDILVASGVEEGRLEYRAEGEDDSVDKNSSAARQLVRRVTFKLK